MSASSEKEQKWRESLAILGTYHKYALINTDIRAIKLNISRVLPSLDYEDEWRNTDLVGSLKTFSTGDPLINLLTDILSEGDP